MPGNAPGRRTCEARLSPPRHPRFGSAAGLEGIEPSRQWTWKPPGYLSLRPVGAAYEDRTRLTRSTIELRRQSHHAAFALSEGVEPSRAGLGNLPPVPPARALGVTHGFRSRQKTRSQRVGFTSSLASQSERWESNPPDVSVPSRAAHLGPTLRCTPSESNRALRVFSAALSPVQLEVPRDPFRNRTGLARLKGGHPHQKTNGPRTADPFCCAACQGWSRSAESNRAQSRYE